LREDAETKEKHKSDCYPGHDTQKTSHQIRLVLVDPIRNLIEYEQF